MSDGAEADRKEVVLARIERLKKLLEEDAPGMLLEDAYREIGVTLEALAHARGTSEGESVPIQ